MKTLHTKHNKETGDTQYMICENNDVSHVHGVFDSREDALAFAWLDSFRRGVVDRLDQLDPGRNREYDSMFWGNVTGHEFTNQGHAYECGIDAVENQIEQEAL